MKYLKLFEDYTWADMFGNVKFSDPYTYKDFDILNRKNKETEDTSFTRKTTNEQDYQTNLLTLAQAIKNMDLPPDTFQRRPQSSDMPFNYISRFNDF